MLKPGPIFIAFCMTVVAAALAVVIVVGLGLRLPLAIAGGIGGVGLIALVIRLVTRGGLTRPEDSRFFELEERIGLLYERVMALEPRLMRIDQAAQETARRSSSALQSEIAELGTLVRALAEQVEAHEGALHDLPARQAAWALAQHPSMPEAPREVYVPPSEPVSRPVMPRRPVPDSAKAKLIRRAIEGEGVELHLQPVASLPQRRVIQYSAVPYLRDENGVLLPPSDFIADAKLAGLQPALDAFVLERTLRVARRLKARDRDISLMVHLEAETFSAPAFTTDIARRLDASGDLASHVVIGFSQDALYGFGSVEAEMLASFGERSFRFVLTGVRDLDLDPQSMHTLGIRFLRVASEILFDPDRVRQFSIHPADLPGLLRRHGILLIAEGADSEARIADLLDLDIRAAQGAVLGSPRPVRPEIFSGEDVAQRSAQAVAPGAGGQPPVHRPFRSVARRA